MNELQMKVEKLKEELLSSLSQGRDDFKNGKVTTSKEMRKEMREKFNPTSKVFGNCSII